MIQQQSGGRDLKVVTADCGGSIAKPVNRAEGNVDKIIYRRFFGINNRSRIFVDVGAARPDFLSISAMYRTLGWRVIAVEPNPVFCAMHEERGHEIIQCACGNRDEDDVDFVVVDLHDASYENGRVSYESYSSLGIKSSYAALNSNLDSKTIKVSLRRLDTILARHAPEIDSVDILSVDVEGWEIEVLDGLDIARYKPRVMVIENLFADDKYVEYMGNHDYVLWRRIHPNDVYVRRDFLARGIQPFICFVEERLPGLFRWLG